MQIKFEDGKWSLAAIGGVPLIFNTSLDIDHIPAPPVVDARLMQVIYKNNVFHMQFAERQVEDDRVPGERIIFYAWRGKQWIRE